VLGACVSGLFVYVYQTRIFFVSTVLVTHMVGAATYLLEVGGCMLVIASLVGFAAVITKRPPVIIAVRVTFRFSGHFEEERRVGTPFLLLTCSRIHTNVTLL